MPDVGHVKPLSNEPNLKAISSVLAGFGSSAEERSIVPTWQTVRDDRSCPKLLAGYTCQRPTQSKPTETSSFRRFEPGLKAPELA